MRARLYKWYCKCGTSNYPDNRLCIRCGHDRIEKHAQVHVSERAVVYFNPVTGEHRTPPRADQPVPEVYSNQGFERHEIMNMTAWEKQSGAVHEATNYSNGNEPIEAELPVLKMDKTAKEALVKDMADAIASGPWTGGI